MSNWAKVFDALMKILAALLPFLLMAEADPTFPLDLFFALLGLPPLGLG